jgi:hypothetical protein
MALGEALGHVAKVGRLDFVLDGSIPELQTPVTLHLERTPVRDALLALIVTAGVADRVEVVVSHPMTVIVRASLPQQDRERVDNATDGATITGTISDAVTGLPILGAQIALDGEAWDARTDRSGRFVVRGVPPGVHSVVVRQLGFALLRIPGVLVAARERRDVSVTMHPTPVQLDQLVVTTATYSAFSEPTRPPIITREHLDRIPHFGADAFRAVAGMPGVSTDDFSSRLHVRGGSGDDLRITFDGVELIDPYHLRAVGGMFSLVDAHAVGELTLAAGDVGAEYGNHLSGVLTIRSPEERRSRTDVVADFNHVSGMMRGQLPWRGAWLVSGRYGFPDAILRSANVTGDVGARFADLFAKASVVLRTDTITVGTLIAGDRFERRLDERSDVHDATHDGYVWASTRSRIGERTSVHTIVSLGTVRGTMTGVGVASTNEPFVAQLPVLSVADQQATHVAAARQDWRTRINDRWLATWGAEATRTHSTHRYGIDSTPPLPFDVFTMRRAAGMQRAASPRATSGGVYTSHRIRLTSRATADVGLRYAAQDATNERVWSPRVHASYAVSPRTTIRGGWGRYAQFERPFEVDVARADTVLDRGDRAEHRAVGVEHESISGVLVRVELYDRIQSRVRPRYYRAPSSAFLFPELTDAPLRLAPEWRRTRGVEVSASSRTGATLGWISSYVYASARERVDGSTVRGSFDDRHSARLEWWYNHERRWRVGGAWRYRSGWPATDRTLDVRLDQDTGRVGIALGPYNGSAHGRYSRLDLRVERAWHGRRRSLALFGDLYNVLDQVNTHAFERAEYVAIRTGDPQMPTSIDRVSEATPVPMLNRMLTIGLRLSQ